MSEKFWMSREAILNPIEKYMKERAERDAEICEVSERLKEAEDEYYDKRSKISALWERSWNLSYYLSDIDQRVLELQDSINASMDGRMLCDHSTVRFLKALDDLLDREISYIRRRTDMFREKANNLTPPKTVRLVFPEPEPKESYSDVWRVLIVAIIFMFGIFAYLVS